MIRTGTRSAGAAGRGAVTFRRSVLQALGLFVALGVFWALVGARLDTTHPFRTMAVVGVCVIGAGWLLVGTVVVLRLRRLRARRDSVLRNGVVLGNGVDRS